MTVAPARPRPGGRRALPHEQTAPSPRPGRVRTQRVLARLALASLVALGAAFAVGAAGGPSPRLTPSSAAGFPGWFAGPLAGLAPGGLAEGAFWALVVAMGASYLAVLALASRLGLRVVVAAIVALHAVLALAPPLLSTDAFGYLAVARAVALPGVSPYSPVREALAGDPVLDLLVWQTRPNPYGPLFTAATLPLAPLGIPAGMWVVKAFAAVSSLGVVGLVARGARRLGRDPVAAVAFVGLNPVLLVWVVGGAHNDGLLMVLVLGALLLVTAGRERLGGAAAAAAVAVKASVGLLVPVLVLGARRRASAVVGVALGLLAAGAIAVAVLGGDIAGFPAALADQAALRSPNSVLHLLATALGLPEAMPPLRAASAAVLAASLLLLYARTARGADPIATAGWATVAALVTTTWLMPWYVVWVLPLAALSAGRGLRAATLAICVFVVATRMPLPLG